MSGELRVTGEPLIVSAAEMDTIGRTYLPTIPPAFQALMIHEVVSETPTLDVPSAEMFRVLAAEVIALRERVADLEKRR